jgi:hypothetical protein
MLEITSDAALKALNLRYAIHPPVITSNDLHQRFWSDEKTLALPVSRNQRDRCDLYRIFGSKT